MQAGQRARTAFLVLWTVVTALKVAVAARLPLFVDEAFYWQEGQHLAAAYSDLPGLTAWMTRLGVELVGHHALGVRLPFLVMGAALPWMISRISSHWFGSRFGWQAGSLTLLMPLSATLGILAVPDVPMAFAAVLCLDAGARLLRGVDAGSALKLAIGLLLGALSHYRFIGVIGVGFIALLLLPDGRRMLRDARVWMALTVGIVAWLPLLAWNLDNQDAGLKFQLVERHPWEFQYSGLWFLVIQPLLVTPLLCLAMWQAGAAGIRPLSAGQRRVQWRYFALVGAVSTLSVFLLGFFTDVERISFHWPLPGYFALLAAAPLIFIRWPRFWRRLAWGMALAGLACAFGYYLMAASPALRESLAGNKYYPRNFVGWQPLADAVREELADMPADTRVLAGSFKVGAELGFLRDDAAIRVLPHPLNDKHGRTAQLALWRLVHEGPGDVPQLLVLAPGDQRYRDLLQRYHQVCGLVGPLPPPRVVSIDRGHQRFLLFRLPPGKRRGACVTPAMAWVNTPLPDAVVDGAVEVQGWAFKDGVGLASVEVLVDGQVAAVADYGSTYDVTAFWKISTDPHHPRVGFATRLRTTDLAPGRHWLGLRLHGEDGSVEEWREQPFMVAPR
ncbi:glycosyltransferase family 39 protein [Stenotrophomonas mori]|uniref:Glycosyltransferase family 39 protein n=1 Tax=Stenotrophomonas mori TaxID=2871096 RepID=A0ABT0SHD1_9GAMM|nr:glycosyltransferase family 39 protein [Stenotrophomonas mori]MCL7714394.1 glycosyltransferase family 39 protein [Stenotrophomonas mori]